jgi:peroxiredoxin
MMGIWHYSRNQLLSLVSKLAIATVLLSCSWLFGQTWAAISINPISLDWLEAVKSPPVSTAKFPLKTLTLDKPTVIYFFDLRCAHCAQVLPQVQPFLQQAHNAGLTVWGITPLASPAAKRLASKQSTTDPALDPVKLLLQVQQTHTLPGHLFADVKRQFQTQYQLRDFTLLLVNRQGMVYRRQMVSYWNTAIVTNLLSQLQYWDRLTTNSWTATVTSTQGADFFPDCFIGTSLQNYGHYYGRVKLALMGLSLGLLVATLLGIWNKEHEFSGLIGGTLLLLLALTDSWLAPWSIYLLIAALLLPYYHRGSALVVGLLYGLVLYQGWGVADSPAYGFNSAPEIWDSAVLLKQILPAMVVAWGLVQFGGGVSRVKSQYLLPVQARPSIVVTSNNAETALDPMVATKPKMNLAVKEVSQAERCDTCHQMDEFDKATGYCQRCRSYTR